MSFVCSEVENMSISTNYYEFIKQIYDYVTKYIKNYRIETAEYVKKLSKIQEKYNSKLKGVEELKKFKNIKTKHILSLSNKIYNVIGTQIDNLKIFIKETEEIIKSFEKTLKEKNAMSSGYLHEYEECKNNLQKKYKDIEKAKLSFFEHSSQTENLLKNFYYKNPKLKENESNQLVTKNQIDSSIKNTKKHEIEYSSLVKTAKAYEDKFFELTDNSNDNMKRISCEIMTKMKDNIINIFINLKNSFKLPIGEIDSFLPELINLDENKKIENIINSTFKVDNNLIRIKEENYNIKIIPKFDDKSMNEDDDMVYLIEDEKIIKIVKTMEENFNLIEKGCIESINTPEKLRTRLLTYKFLSFSDKIRLEIKKLEQEKEINNKDNINNNNIIINENENYSITSEELEELNELLKKLDNKMIFLRKVNNFRRYGNLFPEREFNILCDIFNKIANDIKDDKNFEAQISLVILSETYYKLKEGKKDYILNYIKNNPAFQDKNFWNDFINKSILKEVQRTLKMELNNKEPITNEKKNFDKLVFAQVLPIIKTMIEFELKENIINELVENLVSYYQIDKESKQILFELVNFKGTEKQKEIKDKCQKFLDLSCIVEDENEYRESVYETVNTINNIKLKKQKKENIEDKENEKEENGEKEEKEDNKEKEEENLNSKMIKNMTSDEFEEINNKMIEDGIEEEIEEEENKEEDNKDNKDKKEEKK